MVGRDPSVTSYFFSFLFFLFGVRVASSGCIDLIALVQCLNRPPFATSVPISTDN